MPPRISFDMSDIESFYFRRNKLLTRSFCCKTFAPLSLLPELKIGIDRKRNLIRYSAIFGEPWTGDSKTDVFSGKLRFEKEKDRRVGETRRAEFRSKCAGYRKRRNSQNIKMNPQMIWGQADAWEEARSSPPPLLQPRSKLGILPLPANLRANLKSISSPAHPETLGTYVSTNYSVRGVINVLLNYRRVFSDRRKSIKHARGWRVSLVAYR